MEVWDSKGVGGREIRNGGWRTEKGIEGKEDDEEGEWKDSRKLRGSARRIKKV